MGIGGVLSHSGANRPQVRLNNSVPSVWELGIHLGAWERATSKN